jgi:hypothetical protein
MALFAIILGTQSAKPTISGCELEPRDVADSPHTSPFAIPGRRRSAKGDLNPNHAVICFYLRRS